MEQLPIPSIDRDAAPFVASIGAIVAGAAEALDRTKVRLIRIDNWFGPNWLKFAGKALGAIGVHRERQMPPFHPNRVVSETNWRMKEVGWRESSVARATHVRAHSERFLNDLGRVRKAPDEDSLLVWFSGKSASNRRGSAMIYRFGADPSDDRYIYVGLVEKDGRWSISAVHGTATRRELVDMIRRGQATRDR